jgi:hypothetical protein
MRGSVRWFAVLILGMWARAASADCYEFEFSQSPEASSTGSLTRQTWCYEQTNEEGVDRTLIYAAGGGPRPELSALVERDANGVIRRVAHGSLVRGKVTFHATSGFVINPMPVPLSENEAALLAKKVSVVEKAFGTAKSALRGKLAAAPQSFAKNKIAPGTLEEQLDDSLLPYGAYWWPYDTGELFAGPDSPLAKYDAYVEAKTGSNPQSVFWEQQNHSSTAVSWGGHCNGWAASALLYDEIEEPLWDPATGLTFTTSDINGLYAEASFCLDWAFYGERNNGWGDPADIYPDKFHKVLVYYIQELKKPVILDYFRSEWVDNNVIGGYRFDITEESSLPGGGTRYQVAATLYAHDYDHERNDSLGLATSRSFEYQYTLDVNADGEIIGGQWTGDDNPDFLWVPLSQKNCGRENPYVDPSILDELVTTLPKAVLPNQ